MSAVLAGVSGIIRLGMRLVNCRDRVVPEGSFVPSRRLMARRADSRVS
jgi:hypothetical protein